MVTRFVRPSAHCGRPRAAQSALDCKGRQGAVCDRQWSKAPVERLLEGNCSKGVSRRQGRSGHPTSTSWLRSGETCSVSTFELFW